MAALLHRCVLLTACAGLACVTMTPFDADPDELALTQRSLDALAARAPPDAVVFAALGDSHDLYDDLARTVDAINAQPEVQFTIVAGDLTDRGLLREYEWTHAVLARLRQPYLTVIGNHDALSSGALVYQRMYGPLDYRLRFGGVELVFFNSNPLEFPDRAAPDFAWLDAQLAAAADASARVLVTHQPPLAPAYERLLASHRVTLLVHGHLDEWSLSTSARTSILQCGTYQWTRTHTLVRIERGAASFVRCRFDVCEPIPRVLR